MASLKRVKRRVAELGGTFEDEEGTCTFYIYSPKGTLFRASGISTLCHCYGNPISGERWKREEYHDIMDRLEDGLEDAPEDYQGWW